MSTMLTIGVVGIGAGAYTIKGYNSLVKARQHVRNAESQIDVQIQKRIDLVASMWEMVREYTKHESDVMENTTKMRVESQGRNSLEEKVKLKKETDRSLKNIMAVVEGYPELKSNENYLMLQESLSESEKDTALSRQMYNDSVTIFNTKIEVFPSNLFAKAFNFTPAELFEFKARGGKQ